MNNIYFDLDPSPQETDETDITEIIQLRMTEYQQSQGLIKSTRFLGSMENLGYFSHNRNMLSVISEKDANFGVFSNDVSTLFLGTTQVLISLEDFKNKQDWRNIDIAEWVMVSDRPRIQSTLYLDAFASYGLQPHGQMQWNSFRGTIAFCEVRNADGSRFINKVKQE